MKKEDLKHCNHHHEPTKDHEVINIDGQDIVANKDAVAVLRALNDLGLKTRTHHIVKGERCFLSILLKNVEVAVREVYEKDSTRTKYNGQHELLISWKG